MRPATAGTGVAPTPEQSEARQAKVQAMIAERLPEVPLGEWWLGRVAAAADRVVVRTDAGEVTYRQLDDVVGRVACWARATGLRAGETVAIQLPAGPAFLALVLGLAEVGVMMSLLSTGLRGQSLRHAMEEIPPRLVITTPPGSEELARVGAARAAVVKALPLGPGQASEDLDALDAALGGAPGPAGGDGVEDPAARLAACRRASPDTGDTLFFIFTSGTTGLPKATRCSHRRYLAGAVSEAVLLDMDATDRMYVVLPMFHIAALSAIGAALSVSASVVIRPKFSASRFWADVETFSITTFQYLGEILRYLLAKPPSPAPRRSTLRAMIGAGADTKSWEAFTAHFGPVRIIESYGSSEGVIGISNLDGVPGSVGRPRRDLAQDLAIVRVDATTGGLARDAGWLVRCEEGESGELVARLRDRSGFEGYSSAGASEAKLIEGAFGPGDVWYRSGDLFEERDGYLYFAARLGDTYRWKGENISARQVADAIVGCAGIEHAVAYGVEVAGHDGRAGMALITLSQGCQFDGAKLYAHLADELPPPAIPLFVRVGDGAASLTDTYKLGIAELARAGYDPERVADPLFVLDPERQTYLPVPPR